MVKPTRPARLPYRKAVSARTALSTLVCVALLGLALSASAQKPKPLPIDPADTLSLPVPPAAKPSASAASAVAAPPGLAATTAASSTTTSTSALAPKTSTAAGALSPTSPGNVTPSPPASVAVHHEPIAIGRPHEALAVTATIDNPHLLKQAILVYRVGKNKDLRQVPFLRGMGASYLATIPADDVSWPSVAYAIEIENLDGQRLPYYASREDMHVVSVPEDLMDVREHLLSDHHHDRRAEFGFSTDYVAFGRPTVTYTNGYSKTISDQYYRVEGSFTYRPLRWVLEFSIRGGAVRGQSVVPGGIADPTRPGLDGKIPPDATKVGLNYGAPSVIFRAHDLFHIEAEFLTSVTESGFAVGAGGAFHIGEVYGSKFVLGFESIQEFGTRGYSRLDIVRGRFRASPLVEITNMPHARDAGVRLVTELAYRIGWGWGAAARVAYGARDFNSGGLGGGGSLTYAF